MVQETLTKLVSFAWPLITGNPKFLVTDLQFFTEHVSSNTLKTLSQNWPRNEAKRIPLLLKVPGYQKRWETLFHFYSLRPFWIFWEKMAVFTEKASQKKEHQEVSPGIGGAMFQALCHIRFHIMANTQGLEVLVCKHQSLKWFKPAITAT